MIALSIIIPVWNDKTGLKRLLEQIIEYKIASEVIICDDASTDEHAPDAIGVANLDKLKWKYIRSDTQRGAGAMRNIGLKAASCRHVLFFDSDDLLAPGIVKLLQDIDGKHFDFCIFRHHDSRVVNRRGTFDAEEKLWERAGAAETPRRINMRESAELSRLSAYPWNKIYRKHFLTTEGIKCTEIPVHNDIELHWTSFIAAQTILCSSIIGAEHFVQEGGGRLTNRRSAERLKIFEALNATVERLHRTANRPFYVEPLIDFCVRTIGWAWGNIDSEHHGSFHRLSREFFLKSFTKEEITLAAYRNPASAGRLNRIISGGV